MKDHERPMSFEPDPNETTVDFSDNLFEKKFQTIVTSGEDWGGESPYMRRWRVISSFRARWIKLLQFLRIR